MGFQCIPKPNSNESLLTIATKNDCFHLVNTKTLKTVAKVTGHVGHVMSLDYTFHASGGGILASGGADALVNIWNIDDLSTKVSYRRFSSPIRMLSISCDGSIVASATGDGTLVILIKS